MKIFGSTRYVRTDISDSKLIGNYADVEPFEEFLQFNVKSQWDSNPDNFYLYRNGDISYYLVLAAKKDNNTYSSHKYLREEDITEDMKILIENYFKEL